jgi:hypothetical protein
LASFSVGGTTATFTALATGFDDKIGALEQLTVGILCDNSTAWGALFSLRSWGVTQRPIPGGNTVYVDITGGAGAGPLSIENLDSHTAILIDVHRNQLDGGGRSLGTATFLITA